jgi:transcription elongation factor Elf1
MCKIIGHRYKAERAPIRKNDDERGKIFRCQRCGHEKTLDGSPASQWRL